MPDVSFFQSGEQIDVVMNMSLYFCIQEEYTSHGDLLARKS